MSFNQYKDVIDEKDTVILFFGFDCLLQIKVEKQKVSQTRYGALKHNDLIGKSFGSKIHCSKGWVYVLHPTPELWTVTLPHRTQILYSTDISLVTFQLDLKPGSVVIESGTGSGSLSHSIIRTIAPDGHLYTFDFHEQRVAKAKEEFVEHNIGDLVTCCHRDVLKEGFGLQNVADAVFLDLPAPWEAIPFVKLAMKEQGGRMCSFSPCIEQVQRTCEKLEELGFADIQTLECLTRSFDVRSVNMPLLDMGFGIGKYPDCDVNDLVDKPISEIVHEANTDSLPTYVELKEENPEIEISAKQRRGNKKNFLNKNSKQTNVKNKNYQEIGPAVSFKAGLAPLQMPGHTGYLTFASAYPS